MKNLMMPGNPRYQPKDLVPYFGYDYLARPMVEVELAVMETLCELGVIPDEDIDLLTTEIETRLVSITMSEIDEVERNVTKHDIRALVQIMQSRLPEPLRKWVHIPLTSYDVIDTARALMFKRAHEHVVRPKIRRVVEGLCKQAERYAKTVQVGRTHGQHALPITVGFWLATILHRVVDAAEALDLDVDRLHGKISGAVGAHNAQVGLGLYTAGNNGRTFEAMVLQRLELPCAPISTQIVPPEPLAQYLFSCALLSAALGQFGRDCRHLMRTEIAELSEPFEKGQVGSSTMAHKRNPISFENLEGMWEGNRSEFGKVLGILVSEHQRDLVGSSVARDLPVTVIRLVHQLDTLLRAGKDDARPFIERIVPDEDQCEKNLQGQGDLILAEPMYIALQMAGYPGDAHEVVNHVIVERARADGCSLLHALELSSEKDADLVKTWSQVPQEVREIFENPARYVGVTEKKTHDICHRARLWLHAE
jgi:adenylosuccinate lyase